MAINKSLSLNEDTATAFEVIPNRETMEAIAEISEMKAHPEKYRSYSTFQELLDDVMVDSESKTHDDLRSKSAAFARLQELRKEIAACQPGTMEEERTAAMAEKYNFFEP